MEGRRIEEEQTASDPVERTNENIAIVFGNLEINNDKSRKKSCHDFITKGVQSEDEEQGKANKDEDESAKTNGKDEKKDEEGPKPEYDLAGIYPANISVRVEQKGPRIEWDGFTVGSLIQTLIIHDNRPISEIPTRL